MVRGDVHAVAMPRRRGLVQHGRRYAVLVQADDLRSLSTVLDCPTSAVTPHASFHPEIVVAEGHLTLSEMRAIDDALELVLDLA